MAIWGALTALVKGAGDSVFGAIDKRRDRDRIRRVAEMELEIATLKTTIKLLKRVKDNREREINDDDDVLDRFQ